MFENNPTSTGKATNIAATEIRDILQGRRIIDLAYFECCNVDVQVVENRYNLLVVSKRENMDWKAYVI